MKRALMLIPTRSAVGLRACTYGVNTFFENKGVKSTIFLPVMQTTEIATTVASSVSIDEASALYSLGKIDVLLEKIIANFQAISASYDIIIIQGLLISANNQYTQQLNKKIAISLAAEVLLVASPHQESYNIMQDNINMAARFFQSNSGAKVIAAIINKINEPQSFSPNSRKNIIAHCDQEKLPQHNYQLGNLLVLATIPWSQELLRPKLSDIIPALNAVIVNEGNLVTSRIHNISMCSRGLDNFVSALAPGNLIITAGDRSDIILATSIAVSGGCKIAGLLLTGGYQPHPNILQLCLKPSQNDLAILVTDYDSFTTTQILQNLPMHIKIDDIEQQQLAGNYVASYISESWLQGWLKESVPVRLTPAAFRYNLINKSQQNIKKIILPEAEDERIIEAALLCAKRSLAHIILLGNATDIKLIVNNLGYEVTDNITIIDPQKVRLKYVKTLVAMRKHKGMTSAIARNQLTDNIVLATVMLALGEVDGMVAGAVNTTANTIRPALQLIKTANADAIVSSIFFMCLPNQVIVYGDCAINPDPSSEDLAKIAIASAASARTFGIDPKVAMLSYSTGGSGSGTEVVKVKAATQLVRNTNPELIIDGPLQYDAAINASVAAKKAPDSPVAGRATVCVFPNLNAGNTTYKAVQRSADVLCIGPVLQGLNKPVNDLSRGATVDDIVFTVVITAIQAQS